MPRKLITILAIAIALTMVLSLGACTPADTTTSTSASADMSAGESASASASDSESESASEATQYRIGFSNFSVANTWRVQFEAEFKYAAEQLKTEGVISEYYMTNSQGDATKQIADMQDLITKECDAIIVTAGSPDTLNAIVEEAKSKGIVVVAVDQLVSTDAVDARVAFNNYEFGQTVAQFVSDQLGGKGKVIVLEGIAGAAGNEEEKKGAYDVIDATELEVLADVPCDWDYAKAKAAMEDLITANPQIDGVICWGGAMAQAAMDVLADAGRPLVPICGEANNGYLKEWKKYIPDGYKGLAPSCPPYMSAIALNTAIDILNGNPPADKDIPANGETITEATLDDYLREDLPDSFWNTCWLPEEEIQKLYAE